MSSKKLLQIAKEVGGEYYKTLPYFKTEEEGLKALDALLSQNRSNASLIKDITSMQKNLKITKQTVKKTDKINKNITKQKTQIINSFANTTAKEVVQSYGESQKTLKGIINRHLEKTEWNIVEMKKFDRDVQLFNEINIILEKLGQKTEQLVTKNLKILFKNTVLNDAYFMEQLVDKPTNLTILNSKRMDELIKHPWSGLPYSERIWKDVDQMKLTLKEQLTQSMILGESPKKLSKRINEKLGNSAYNASRLARTEVISLGARTQEEFAKDNDDLVQGMKWTACIDTRTSKICLSQNGQVKTVEEWNKSDRKIPCHPNCRCSYVMEVKDKYKIDKKVESFEDWTKRKRENGEILGVSEESKIKPKTPKN